MEEKCECVDSESHRAGDQPARLGVLAPAIRQRTCYPEWVAILI